MGTNVTVRSFCKEREAEFTHGPQKKMERVGVVVERQTKILVSQSPPSHPQVQTGRLRSSIIHNIISGEGGITAEIGTNVKYSKYLEFGTVNMPPYPFLFPAVESKRAEIIDILKGHEVSIE